MSRSRFETHPADRLPSGVKVGIAAGYAAANAAPAVFGILLFPIFNILMGLSPALLGGILFFQRVWEATVDPLVGQVSDRLRTRWGRRRPFVLFAALPMAAAFAAIWCFPERLGPGGLLAYLLITSLLFFTLHSCYSIPLVALGMEASGDYHERTRLNASVQIVTYLVLICAQWVFPFIQLPVFSDTRHGSRCFGLIFGALTGGGAILPFFLVRGKAPAAEGGSTPPPFWAGLRSSLGNSAFVHLLAIRTLFRFSYSVVSMFGLYLNYYAVFRGDIRGAAIMQGWNGTVFQLAAIASLMAYRQIALRHGKRLALVLSGAVLALGSLSKLFVYVPGHPWWQVVVYAANGAADAGVAMLVDAMLPDTADLDEHRTGLRREGFYAAVLAWFDRISYSCGTLISGFFLVAIGFSAGRGGAQAASTLLWMKWSYFALPFGGACAVGWFAWHYPLDEETGYRLKADLELRRAATDRILPTELNGTTTG
ncbi:MAG TPA: MFS transporter [Opitutaceae bacterium]|nr:MFS transporter [Opitutaceae bacterium]